MSKITPKQAIDAAVGVYDLQDGLLSPREAFVKYPDISNNFDLAGSTSLNSKAGAFVFKSKSGFGMIAKGKGRYQGEVLISLRGTASAYDWVTDANAGIQLSTTGKFVHAGFNRVFNEFEPDLKRFFSLNNFTRVHCVGHSLGGALAALTADWVSKNKFSQASLYTFGSPRVGFYPFSDRLTQQLGADNILRVHHHNDIVSLIPVWPFVHMPQPGMSCCLNDNGYNPISAHYKHNYTHSLSKASDWAALKSPGQPELGSLEIKNWLSLKSIAVLSSYALGMIGKAISYILKAAGISVQLLGIGGITVLDQLSFALDKAIQVSKEISGFVTMLLEKILSIVGMGINVAKNITVEFIRWVFSQLSHAVYRMVNLALTATV